MKKLVIACLCTLILAGCLPEIMSGDFGPLSQPFKQEPVDLGSMTIDELYAEYDQNKIVAENKYTGKAIRLSGTVENINAFKRYNTNTYKEEIESYSFRLKNSKGQTILCFFDKSQESSILALKEGQKVTVYGIIGKIITFRPDLENCRIVKP